MVRSTSTLKSELEDIGEPEDDAAVCAAWATAFHNYFNEAASGPGGSVPITPQATAKTAMQGALAGMSAANAGAAKLLTGITLYWTTLAGVISAAFAGAIPGTCVPPAALPSLNLQAVFTSNTSGKKSLADSCQAIADAIHTACTGGMASFPPPPAGTPQPIL